MQRSRHAEHESGDLRVELGAVVGQEPITAFHAPGGCLDQGATGVLAGLAGLYGLEVEGSATYSSRDLAGGGGLELAAYVPQEPWYSLASPYVAVELAQLGLRPGEPGAPLSIKLVSKYS